MAFALDESSSQSENLKLPDAEASLHHNFLTTQQADQLLSALILETPWRQDYLTFGGRKVVIPRLQAWVGDASKEYAYSGLQLSPLPWTKTLLKTKRLIEEKVASEFNSVLLNYYRNGQDSVSWHSDDEKELGTDPLIASLSLGVSRCFEFKHRHLKPTLKFKCQLDHGCLLVMGTGLQQNWLHQIPKQQEIIQPRVNLTFRKIIL